MVTTASKFFFAGALVALVSSYVYGLGTDGQIWGVLTMGLKGAVGEVAGYTILQAVAFTLLGLGTVSSILRDADPEVQAAVARLELAPPVTAPAGPSYWPVLGALSAVLAAVGLVASPVLFVIGALGALLVTLEWMVTAWSERATGDAELNRQIRNRLMLPIEIPVGGALIILITVVSISRVLLAVTRVGSSVVAIVVATLVLAVGFLVAYRPKLGRNVVAGLLAVFAVVVVAGGVIGATSGTREFHPHEEEHGEGTGGAEEEHGDDGAGGEEEAPSADDGGDEGDADTGEDGDTDDGTPGTAEGSDDSGGQSDEPELAPEDDGSEG